MRFAKLRLKIIHYREFGSPKLVIPSYRQLLLLSSLVFVAGIWYAKTLSISPSKVVDLNLSEYINSLTESPQLIEPISEASNYQHTVVKGDTLSTLFTQANIAQSEMYRVLEADLDVLVLDSLIPGNIVEIWTDSQQGVQKLSVSYSAARQFVFTRGRENIFEVEEIKHQGIWQHRMVSGEIDNSFYQTALHNGLADNQIQEITTLLGNKLNFSRDIQTGDSFKVLVEDQYINGSVTGDSKVLAVYISCAKGDYNAFQFDDGNFYDELGYDLYASFQRLPLKHKARLSSKFNPHRKHPITGRTAPHNGSDFAVPIGTEVLATSDGIVTLVTNHPFAGKYLVVKHNEKYLTRYLHLSKTLVKKGQKVARGQVIALSGNTGRTTGPHLHYEFHINGKPQNPLTAKLPAGRKLTRQQFGQFLSLVKRRKLMMGLG